MVAPHLSIATCGVLGLSGLYAVALDAPAVTAIPAAARAATSLVRVMNALLGSRVLEARAPAYGLGRRGRNPYRRRHPQERSRRLPPRARTGVSALLRQPGGFEGFIRAGIHLPPLDTFALDRVDDGEAGVDPRVAAARFAALVDRHHDPVPARIENLLDLVAPPVIWLDPDLEEVVELVQAAKLALTRPAREGAHIPDHIGCEGLGQPLRLNECGDPLPNDLDVLLRHRLLPPPGRFEGVRWIEVVSSSDHTAVFKPVHGGKSQLDRHLAPTAHGRLPVHRDQTAITGVDQLLDLVGPTVETLGPSLQGLNELLAAASRSR